MLAELIFSYIVTIIAKTELYNEKQILPDQLEPTAQIYQLAGEEYNYPWQILSAIHEKERNRYIGHKLSSAGAKGCMQFMPNTFKFYGVDGNRDGQIDIYNCTDAIYSAANYLSKNKKVSSTWNSIWRYNHDNKYVSDVWRIAKDLGWKGGN